jgi:hypothetical protein
MDADLSASAVGMATTDADKWIRVGIHVLIPGA